MVHDCYTVRIEAAMEEVEGQNRKLDAARHTGPEETAWEAEKGWMKVGKLKKHLNMKRKWIEDAEAEMRRIAVEPSNQNRRSKQGLTIDRVV
jgi:hypothetical protein